jgi:hypothetical protein
MTDGDVSHSSKIKLHTFRTVAVLDLFSFWVFFLLSFHIISTFSLFI